MGAERVDVANRGASVSQPEPNKPLPPFWGYDTDPPPEVDLGDLDLPAVPANDDEVR
jgi:hypothetical protein